MSDAGHSQQSGHVELLTAANTLQSVGPNGAVTVSSSPLYDAVMALFRFSKEQAVKHADEAAEVRREMGQLREVVERQQEHIKELEGMVRVQGSTVPQGMSREAEHAMHQRVGNLEEDLAELKNGTTRRLQKMHNEVTETRDDLEGSHQRLKSDVAKTSEGVDVLRSNVASQLREVAMASSRVESQCSARLKDTDDQVKNLSRAVEQLAQQQQQQHQHQQQQQQQQQPPKQIVVQQQPPPQQEDPAVLREAFSLLKDRMEDLEETRDEQSKAAMVITQYFDKLDHLYALLELDKRAAAYGASATSDEKLNLLMTLPVFEELLGQIRHTPPPMPVLDHRPVTHTPTNSVGQYREDLRGVSPTRPHGSINVSAAGVEIKDRQDAHGGSGATVVSVTPGGPASDAGWKVGDHIVGIKGTPLGNAREFSAAASAHPHSTVPVTRIPAGHYRPVSGTVTFSNPPPGERSWH